MATRRRRGDAGLVLGGMVFGLVGLVAMGILGYSIWWTSKAAQWPVAEGTVMRSEVTSRRGSKGGRTLGASIEYQYLVGNRTYTGDRVVFGDYSSSGGGHARELVEKYPAGARVEVRYNPEDPGDAILDPTITWFVWFMCLLFGGIFGTIGAGMALAGIRR